MVNILYRDRAGILTLRRMVSIMDVRHVRMAIESTGGTYLGWESVR
jgi:hypothetical protein